MIDYGAFIVGFILGRLLFKFRDKIIFYLKYIFTFIKNYKVIKESEKHNDFLEDSISDIDYSNLNGRVDDHAVESDRITL